VSAPSGRAPAWGGTVTHVIGQRLEWHAELLVHARTAPAADGGRGLSAVAGLQYTFDAGVNVVLEYHRNGHGLGDEEWDAVLIGARSPGQSPSRQHRLFVRAARPGPDHSLSPELIVVAGLDERSWTVVPALTWTPVSRVQVYGRITRLLGEARSVAAFAPWSTAVTAGATLRF
jgi:hypothetical protein